MLSLSFNIITGRKTMFEIQIQVVVFHAIIHDKDMNDCVTCTMTEYEYGVYQNKIFATVGDKFIITHI